MGIERIESDSFNLSTDEAVEFTVHHLRLAALFFEATPEDAGEQLREEIERMAKLTNPAYRDPWVEAARAFVDRITHTFEGMRKADSDEAPTD